MTQPKRGLRPSMSNIIKSPVRLETECAMSIEAICDLSGPTPCVGSDSMVVLDPVTALPAEISARSRPPNIFALLARGTSKRRLASSGGASLASRRG